MHAEQVTQSFILNSNTLLLLTMCASQRALCPPTAVSQLVAAQFTRGNSFKFILLAALAKSNSAARETLGGHTAS